MPTLIILVTHNGLPLTKLALASCVAQDVPCDILVADNASTDGTVSYLKTKQVALMAYQEQIPLAACWNRALKAAWSIGYNSALVLNSDLEIRPDTVSMLSLHGGDFVTCVSVDERSRMGVAGDRDIDALRKGEREHPDFSAFFIRKSVTDRGLWFNEECWPAYTEDSFFHVMMHRTGVRAVCIDLPFLHHGASTLKQADEREAVIIRRGADQNRARFKMKYGCSPGTPEYEKLFSPEFFGIDRRATSSLKPSKHLLPAEHPHLLGDRILQA